MGSKAAPTVEPGRHVIGDEAKWAKWWVRVSTTLVMIAFFLLVIYLGHWALCAAVLALSVFGFAEVEQLMVAKARTEVSPCPVSVSPQIAFLLHCTVCCEVVKLTILMWSAQGLPFANRVLVWYWFALVSFYLHGRAGLFRLLVI